MFDRSPIVISIAGFDPSGGAGVLADIKTFESHGVYGLGIVSALTFQTDNSFIGLKWVPVQDILNQLLPLLERFRVDHVKIGIIENLSVLRELIDVLRKHNPEVKIIWDPVLKASAGFLFHQEMNRNDLLDLCDEISLVTPNRDEITRLFPDMQAVDAAKKLGKHCRVYLKSAVESVGFISDFLFEESEVTEFKGQKIEFQKHGTGCVFSSAVTANLAGGFSLKLSCEFARDYVRNFMKSNQTLLGFHSYHQLEKMEN